MSEDLTPVEGSAVAPYTGPSGIAGNIHTPGLSLPRVMLLQSMSPQVQNNPDVYKPGMFIDHLTQEILPTPITFIPSYIFGSIIKWRPRNEGGGMIYKTIHPTPAQIKDSMFDGDIKPVADRSVNAIATIDGFAIPVIITFAKTSCKWGDSFEAIAGVFKPCWSQRYELYSERVTNNQGTFYVMKAKRVGKTTPAEMQAGLEMYEQVKSLGEQIIADTNEDTTGSTEGASKEF